MDLLENSYEGGGASHTIDPSVVGRWRTKQIHAEKIRVDPDMDQKRVPRSHVK